MDAPLNGPMMRWQRKTNESNLSLRGDINCSLNASVSRSFSTSKTPIKNKSLCLGAKTPGKTPSKNTPGRHGAKTPGKGNKTPGKGNKTPVADRFIPNRSASHFDLGNFLINKEKKDDETLLSPSKREYRQIMQDNLKGPDAKSKILAFNKKAPTAPDGHTNSLRVLYSQSKTQGTASKTTRHIPQVPERILDAPDLMDDYYLNLLDWSATNQLAVCLGGRVYLWNAATGDIHHLLELEGPEEYVCSVNWMPEGSHLAVGTSEGSVLLWDVAQKKRLRSMQSQTSRVGCLSWNSYVISSGSRSGNIHHHDVRVPNHHVGTLEAHAQEVCGLRWSPDGRYLASGGNDNILQIWAADGGGPLTQTTPLHTLSQHQAAVKALAWCPWQPSLLASGGGTADRTIRFWSASTGSCLNSIDTKSQVCALLWSKEHRELISSHGYAQNQLCIWKYPSMTKISELTGHTARVLHMAMSPDGATVVSAAADETLRIWKCFSKDPTKAKKESSAKFSSASQSVLLRQNIR